MGIPRVFLVGLSRNRGQQHANDTTYVVDYAGPGQGARTKKFSTTLLTVLVSDFNYELHEALIAQEPLKDRAASRLLHLNHASGALSDREFRDFPGLLARGDVVVLNDTRVFPARLFGHRSGARAHPVSSRNPSARDFLRGRVEVLLTSRVSGEPNDWACLVRPGRKIGVGE